MSIAGIYNNIIKGVFAMKKIKVLLVGAGLRGVAYTDIMSDLPEKFEVVAVADPNDDRRNYIKNKHNIAEDYCFTDWRQAADLPKFADVAIIGTQDKYHYEPAIAFMNKKYNLLLEKPVSTKLAECVDIAKCAKENNVKVMVCHVLRYAPLFMKIKQIIDSGRIGEIVSINHEENVGNRHHSHSYTRGNWGNEERSSFMLLAKSCHDIDLLQWLVGKKCKKVQSFGSLKYFRAENAPEGAPEYCIDGCPNGEECLYNAVTIYLKEMKAINEHHFFRRACANSTSPTDEMVEKALRTTQYGKCVFKCDNDVVDHQTVNMLFEGDTTVTFTMCSFNKGGRWIHIMGTLGEIKADLSDGALIEVFDFKTRTTEKITANQKEGLDDGHGGGDSGIIYDLYDYLTGKLEPEQVSEINISCYNHLLTFAAEEARVKNEIIDIDDFIKANE